MNATQKRYDQGFYILGSSQRFNTTNYFRTIDLIRSRPNQFPTSPKKYIIKSIIQEPYKDIYVIRANQKLRLKLDTIQSKPVIPKLNTEFIEIEQRMRNNKDKARELYNRALSLQNEKFIYRVFSQKPRIINTKLLEKLYEEKHDKYIEQLKSPRIRKNSYKSNLLPVRLPKISKNNIHFRTEVNLDSDNEDSNDNDNNLELKDHEHKEINHQKQGHIEGQHRNNNYQAETSE